MEPNKIRQINTFDSEAVCKLTLVATLVVDQYGRGYLTYNYPFDPSRVIKAPFNEGEKEATDFLYSIADDWCNTRGIDLVSF